VSKLLATATAFMGLQVLSSCTSLDLLHDPQSGTINRSQINGFIKSVRCELKTFYDLNWRNSTRYLQENKKYQSHLAAAAEYGKHKNITAQAAELSEARAIRSAAVIDYPHFLLSDQLFGGVYLDLKVVDTLGVGSSDVNATYKHTLGPAHSFSWSIAPTANTQNTYEMNYSFIIDQKTGLAKGGGDDGSFQCYSTLDQVADFYGLAMGKYSEHERFTRILVNGVEPLAVWLLDNSKDLWNNFRAKSADLEQEQIIPLQMNYTFSVQITVGLDVKYSLISPLWNAAQFGGTAASVQTSQLQLFLNGVDAFLVAGAKTGTAVNAALAGDKPPTAPFVPIGQINEMSKAVDSRINRLQNQVATEHGIAIQEQQSLTNAQKQQIAPAAKQLLDQIDSLKTQKAQLDSLKRQVERLDSGVGVRAVPRPRGYLLYPPALPNP
jgi:hypothetical protein